MHKIIRAAALTSILSVATSSVVLVGVFAGATTAFAAIDSFLKIEGIKGESNAVVRKQIAPDGKTMYRLTFSGKPAAPGTYQCANGQHIRVVGPDGMMESLSFSWAANSTRWSATVPDRE
jgi:hypothetical protein